jgi:hypothetical protein
MLCESFRRRIKNGNPSSAASTLYLPGYVGRCRPTETSPRSYWKLTYAAQATPNPSFDIPVVDFSNFHTGTSPTKRQIADQILGAFKTSGFVYLSNHGIPAEMISDVFQKVCPTFCERSMMIVADADSRPARAHNSSNCQRMLR